MTNRNIDIVRTRIYKAIIICSIMMTLLSVFRGWGFEFLFAYLIILIEDILVQRKFGPEVEIHW